MVSAENNRKCLEILIVKVICCFKFSLGYFVYYCLGAVFLFYGFFLCLF